MDLQFVYDLIVYTNDNILDDEDKNGNETIKVLSNTRKILQIINSKEAGSLGLHPIIYFYSKKGNFKPANFYAITLFVKQLKRERSLIFLQVLGVSLRNSYIKMIIYLIKSIGICVQLKLHGKRIKIFDRTTMQYSIDVFFWKCQTLKLLNCFKLRLIQEW